jgi:hypothetical protein
MDKMFVIKVGRQYNYWLHLFQEKKKKWFIPLPWKVEDLMLRNVKKIEEFAACFSNLRLIYVETLTGFDPDKIFLQHLQTLGLGNFFFKKHPTKNRDTSDNAPASDVDDLDTLQNTIELSKQQGKDPGEKSVQSTNNTPISTTSRSIAPTSHHNKKRTQSYSKGGDNDPPHPKIDNSHKLPVDKKKKKLWDKWKSPKFRVRTWNLNLIWIAYFATLIIPQMRSSIIVQWTYLISNISTKMNPSCSRALFLTASPKKYVKNKKEKSRSEVNLANMRSSQICQLHIVIGDALDYSIGGIEAENARLKDRVK